MKNKYQLSILIPARNEIFLSDTIKYLIRSKNDMTEIIAVCDGAWANPQIKDHPDVTLIHTGKVVGQRAATNLACKLSKAKYVMKLDAHCLTERNFDLRMIEAFEKTGDNVLMTPIMRNLWIFDWKCMKCGKRTYQGPTPTSCEDCDNTDNFTKKMKWKGKSNPQSTSYCFDSEPHFQYFEDYKHRPQYIKDKKEKGLTETMSLQGSCFMCTREKYNELNICDEEFGSWGNQGIEISTKFWLTGGKVLVNHKTWQAHLFRTSGGDFSFPYENKGKEVSKCKARVRKILWKNRLKNQKYPLSWLVEKFMPVKGWSEEKLEEIKKYDNKIRS